MKIIYLVIAAVLFHSAVVANTRYADRLFDNWDYFHAAKLYLKEAEKHPGADIYFKLGECYRKMNLYKDEQAAYDKVNAYGVYSKPEFYLNYGQALRSNGRNEQAAAAFEIYSKLLPSDSIAKFFSKAIEIVAADHKWDEPISLTNTALLNTPSADLCPAVYRDGIVYTSNRKAPGRNKIYGWTGANYLDLYYAKKGVNGLDFTGIATFADHKIIRKFNNGPACFSRNFDTIYVSRVDKDLKGTRKKTLSIERNKIFMSVSKDGKWANALPFHLNSDHYSVANPSLSPDGSRIFFVSDMPGGFGETDIYYCNREGSGWGPPMNMGENVNTFNREKYPMMDARGNFYFSSDGYQGLGGLDICIALNIDGSLAKAIPMKYPFNSTFDDFGIMFLKEGKEGYITSNRYDGGIGDDDIFYFNLLTDNLDPRLETSIYTIGYRPVKPGEPVLPSLPVVTMAAYPEDILVYFDFDKSQIRADAIVGLDSVVYYMNKFPTLSLLITGHCDCRGTSNYNIDLAARRSEAAFRYLKGKGISPRRMAAEGYGTGNPVNRCEKGINYTDSIHQLNRRVYVHFMDTKN